MNPFFNKVAIVTGGGSGIGKAICKQLGSSGTRVIVADRNFDDAQKTEREIVSGGGVARAVYVDVSIPDEVEELVTGTVRDFGRIDLLFNNAGISINGEFQDLTPDHWKRVFDVNMWGVVNGCRYAYPVMMKQGSGRIINTASLAGLIPGGLTTIYHASKHAVVGFSLVLRAEARLYGINVSVLCPGYLRTNIQSATPLVTAYMNAEPNRRAEAGMKFLTPDDCIGQIMRGIRRNRAIIVTPGRQRLFWWLHRMFPGAIPPVFTMIIRRMKKNAYEGKEVMHE